MEKTLILAHDLGTSGNKATLYDAEGTMLASSFSGYPTEFPAPGWAEQDPEQWWTAVKTSTRRLLQQVPGAGERVDGISFSGHMMSCCPVDEEGAPLRRAIIWSDQRAYREKDALARVFGDEDAYRRTGTVWVANYLAAKALWLRENEPEVFRAARRYLMPKDFVAHRLTGRMVTDYSDASGTNLFDIRAKRWCEDIAGEIGLEFSTLPPALPSTSTVAGLDSRAAEELGLRRGVPVIIGGGDGPCATAGAGASGPGICYNSYGTSSWNAVATGQPLYDAKRRIFILCHLDPDRYMAAGTMQFAGGSFEWLNGWLGATEGTLAQGLGLSSYDLLSLEAERAEPASGGVLFLPYLLGERSPYWDPEVTGAFIGLTRSTGRGEIIRAVLEGTVYHLKLILDVLIENGAVFDEVRLIGGGGRSGLLRKLMADIWGVPVVPMRYLEEASSLGAALAGLVGIGARPSMEEAVSLVRKGEQVAPDPAAHQRYQRYYPLFGEAYHALREVNKKIHAAQNAGRD